jgi:large subunit ribosomal protein L18
MKKKEKKLYLQTKKRFLKKTIGTSEKPRLAVFRSHKHIYAQLIDDMVGKTIASASTLEKQIKNVIQKSATKEASFIVGKTLAEKAAFKNVTKVAFDRGNKPYQGRIKSLADGARNSGLIF